MTFNGSAIHNVENALGVIGLSRALKLQYAAIRSGLQSFGSDAKDNPGRGNQYQVNGFKVIVDFAHNEHSMNALVDMVNRMPANNRIVMFGHAGDRSDRDISDLSEAVLKLQANTYIISELENYLRGRELGDIPSLVKSVLVKHQVDEGAILKADNPLQGAQRAIEIAQPGDVVLLFVLDQRDEVHRWLSEHAAEA